MIRVLLVDDQTLIRQGIQFLLDMEPDIEVVGLAANGQEALSQASQCKPDVVLMDVRMPLMDGVTATRHFQKRFPEMSVLILTTFDDDETVFEGLSAGACGYLLKDISSEEMAEAVRTVARGDGLIQPSITRRVVSEFARLANNSSRLGAGEQDQLLTRREFQVLRLLAGGLSNREIAEQLVITRGTVKNHVSSLLGKLEARDRTQAVLKAQELGLV